MHDPHDTTRVPRRQDEEHDPPADEVEQIDPDAPARSVFDEDEDAVEPNEPA